MPDGRDRPPLFDLEPSERGRPLARWQVRAAIASVLFAAFFLFWVLLGVMGAMTPPLALFGLTGVRVVAALIVAGLLGASLLLADF